MSQQVNVYRELRFFKQADGTAARMLLGDSSTSLPYTAGTPPMALYFTSSNTGSTNAEPIYVKSTMTGAGGYGGRCRFHATYLALSTAVPPPIPTTRSPLGKEASDASTASSSELSVIRTARALIPERSARAQGSGAAQINGARLFANTSASAAPPETTLGAT